MTIIFKVNVLMVELLCARIGFRYQISSNDDFLMNFEFKKQYM